MSLSDFGGGSGSFGIGRIRKKTSKTSTETLPAYSFYGPHWELVFRGILPMKTRQNGSYRPQGLTLCYTSLEDHKGPMAAHGISKLTLPRGIVGCADISAVRQNSFDERVLLFKGYNNREPTNKELRILKNGGITGDLLRQLNVDPKLVWPMDWVLEFNEFERFDIPFMTLTQHMFSSIGRIPLYPQIRDQLPRWATKRLKKAA